MDIFADSYIHMGLDTLSHIWLNDGMDNTIDALRLRLAKHKGHWPILAQKSGVPISTLRKIAQGQVMNPRIRTVDKLHAALDAQ